MEFVVICIVLAFLFQPDRRFVSLRHNIPFFVQRIRELEFSLGLSKLTDHVKPDFRIDRKIRVGFVVGVSPHLFRVIWLVVHLIGRIPRRKRQRIALNGVNADFNAANRHRVLPVQISDRQYLRETIDHLMIAVDLKLIVAVALAELNADFVIPSAFNLSRHFLMGSRVGDGCVRQKVVQIGIGFAGHRAQPDSLRIGDDHIRMRRHA